MIDSMLSALSAGTQHGIEPWAYWHARLMVLGWGVLLPLGALAARYFKITPRQQWPDILDNKAWWYAHLAFQCAGIAAVSLGVVLALGHGAGASRAARVHAVLGWALVVAGWLQVAAGLGRGSKGGPTCDPLRGDHYDMTAHRIWFERLHKGIGWLSVFAAVAVIGLGLHMVDAPGWIVLILGLWWTLLGCLAWRWQRQGRCIDTYQAIWGPDPYHPGNHHKPIGWGVRRPQP